MLQQVLLLSLLSATLIAAQQQLAVLPKPEDITTRQIVANEVFFTTHQKRVLGEDIPFRDLALSQHYLWMLGNKHVWHFNLRSQQLRKYTFPLTSEELANTFISRADNEQDIYLATTTALFKLQAQPLLVKRMPHKITQTIAFSAIATAFVWFTEEGIYFLQRPTHKLWHVPYQLQRGDRALAAPQLDAIWVVRGNKLLRVAGEQWQEETVLTAPYLTLGSHGKSLFIGRGNTVLHYSWQGQLAQVIPVAHQRHLQAMHIAADGHGYIFTDGLLEYYRTSTKTILKTKLKLRPQTKINHLDMFSSRIAFIDNGKIRIFVLKKTPQSKLAK